MDFNGKIRASAAFSGVWGGLVSKGREREFFDDYLKKLTALFTRGNVTFWNT